MLREHSFSDTRPSAWLRVLSTYSPDPFQTSILRSARAIMGCPAKGVHDGWITVPGYARMAHERDVPEMRIREDDN